MSIFHYYHSHIDHTTLLYSIVRLMVPPVLDEFTLTNKQQRTSQGSQPVVGANIDIPPVNVRYETTEQVKR